ncbi:MAG TPA: glucose-6-phosphate dehydrogenase [Acidimicrobiia bacterium]
MNSVKPEHADGLILFGITGNLGRTMLFPALYDLTVAGRLDLPVVGVASSDLDDDGLRDRAREALAATGRVIDPVVFDRLAANLCYVSGDYRDPELYPRIAARLEDRRLPVAYLAIPPDTFADVVAGLTAVGLNERGRIVVEKPFGRDYESAAELNELLHRGFPESRVFRIDHFLGKEAVQNLMVFRFSNTILEPVWNRHFVAAVQITLAEEYGIEGRGRFYDGVGALRDVVQNHLLQMAALLAMEPPVSDHPDALRDERAKVMRAMRAVDPGDLVLGQYSGYLEEEGVAPDSATETYAAIRLEIDSWRWAGVPWIIRAGKGLSRTVTEAAVEFRAPPRPLFASADEEPGPNRLVFRTKPDDQIVLSMQARIPGAGLVSGPVELHLQHDRPIGVSAYTRLLGDALRGDQSLFAREDGVMEAWRVVEPLLHAGPPVEVYDRGSWGPKSADRLLDPGMEWITR